MKPQNAVTQGAVRGKAAPLEKRVSELLHLGEIGVYKKNPEFIENSLYSSPQLLVNQHENFTALSSNAGIRHNPI